MWKFYDFKPMMEKNRFICGGRSIAMELWADTAIIFITK